MACSEVSHFAPSQQMEDIDQGTLEIDVRRWTLSGEFGKKGSGPGEFNGTFGITATQPGELAVADYWNKRVVICSTEGKLKETILLSDRPRNVAAIPQMSMLLVVDTTKYVKVFNKNNKLDFQFPTVPLQDIDNIDVDLRSLAVKRDDTIVVGDVKRMVWTEHKPTNGELLRTVSLQIPPFYLAFDEGTDRTVVSGYEQKQVDVTDSVGTTLSTVQPSIQDRPVTNCLAVNSGNSGLYVGVSNGWNSDGHIHLYDVDGNFLDCLAQGLTFPLGITFTSDGQLVVADGFSVKTYRKM
ncbi:uncharacterized protein LOC119723627 [Patiria miniata]|uniref:Uncharacterized protein n=1 Tax=Patiria miniata TaxID=46514 RepID=A0A913ZH03_PATMI|nr:uncharacterized protein LOC119723627 [Patiria miniata]